MLYFSYGSNMNHLQMISRCPSATSLGTVYLEGYRLGFCGHSAMRCGGVANILRNGNSWTPGILWSISENDARSLDRFEGVPFQYQRTMVPLTINGSRIWALTYIMENNSETAPSEKYLNIIRDVYVTRGWKTRALDRLRKPKIPLFIYGSLRKGASNHSRFLGTAESRFMGEAKTATKFDLFDLGHFPGMVRGSQAVVGEIWNVSRMLLSKLDAFEGHPTLYRRSSIQLDSGRIVNSYIYTTPREKMQSRFNKIHSGDWMDHWNGILVDSKDEDEEEDLDEEMVEDWNSTRWSEATRRLLQKMGQIPRDF